jgi:hypothetical protein
MPTVSELVEVVSEATGEPLATVRMIARRLIDDEVLPKSVGARIPHVTPEHAASLLFAVMATPAIKDSARTAVAFSALMSNGMSANGETALDAVARLLRGLPKDSAGLEWSLEVCTNFPQIALKKKTWTPQIPHPSERTDYGSIYIPAGEDWMHWPSENLKRFAVLPGTGLYRIALALAGDE